MERSSDLPQGGQAENQVIRKWNNMTHANAIDDVKNKGERAARQAARSPWVEGVMRMGYAVRGVLYGLIGILAIQVALGGGGRFTDQQGAIATIGAQPFGKILLILIAIGLAGYALWGFIRAALDPLHKGNDAKGWVTRLGYLVSGLSYGALLFPTLRLITNAGGGGGSSAQSAAAPLLTHTWGQWLVGLVGLAIFGAGVAQIVEGWKADFDMRFDAYALNASQRRWATRLGRFGYIARGVVLDIIGAFLVQAAIFQDPSKVRGLDGALVELTRHPYGVFLLAIVAAGLIAFGAYSLLGAAWFRFKKP